MPEEEELTLDGETDLEANAKIGGRAKSFVTLGPMAFINDIGAR